MRRAIQLDKKLLTAMEGVDLNEVRGLIAKGANIDTKDKDGNTLLYSAAEMGDLDRIKFLLDNGANIETENGEYQATPLHGAVENYRLDAVKSLLSRGANVNAEDKGHWTPLHYAADTNRLDVVKLLVGAGANLGATSDYGKTPLDIAIDKKHVNVEQYLRQVQLDKKLLLAVRSHELNEVKNLISQGASLEAKDGDDNTPLHWTSWNGHLDVVKYLVENGANLEAKDYNGKTPLHWASLIGHLDVVKYLISKGADINAKANYGKTPLDIAIDKKHDNVEQYLKKVKEERGKPVQRRRRHHHGDHNRHYGHLSRKPLAIDLSNQPEIATSSAARPSSWINDLFSWVRDSVGGLFSSRVASPEETLNTTTQNSISQIDAPIDVNGTIMLFDLLIRKVTGQKYISTLDQSISPLEAQGYALNITKGFEKVVEQAGLKSGVSMHRLNIDFVEIQKEVTGKIISGKFDEISGVLNSYLEEACPGREAGCPGKLSPKKFDKFMLEFNSRLNVVLDQSIQQILHNVDGTLEVDGAKQMSLEPQSYLSNASVQGHSKDKVSTCLSEIGVTKLGGNLNR